MLESAGTLWRGWGGGGGGRKARNWSRKLLRVKIQCDGFEMSQDACCLGIYCVFFIKLLLLLLLL
jgi:hypothetical protein